MSNTLIIKAKYGLESLGRILTVLRTRMFKVDAIKMEKSTDTKERIMVITMDLEKASRGDVAAEYLKKLSDVQEVIIA